MDTSSSIRIWNRAHQRVEEETVYGDRWIKAAYQSTLGKGALKWLTRPWFSRLYGAAQSTPSSTSKIPGFITKFKIPMEEFDEGPFANFNEFFVRKFKPGRRPFPAEPQIFPAFAEGRYLVFENVPLNQPYPIKDFQLSLPELLSLPEHSKKFENGFVAIARLCPVDYHRFHFPDAGRVRDQYTRSGPLDSVNPIALSAKPNILFENERQIAILETKNFGTLAYIEVGALCVGKIVQTYTDKKPSPAEFTRGDEKGYFLFGGSTVIVVGERGRVKFDPDILDRSRAGMETLVKLGEGIGKWASKE